MASAVAAAGRVRVARLAGEALEVPPLPALMNCPLMVVVTAAVAAATACLAAVAARLPALAAPRALRAWRERPPTASVPSLVALVAASPRLAATCRLRSTTMGPPPCPRRCGQTCRRRRRPASPGLARTSTGGRAGRSAKMAPLAWAMAPRQPPRAVVSRRAGTSTTRPLAMDLAATTFGGRLYKVSLVGMVRGVGRGGAAGWAVRWAAEWAAEGVAAALVGAVAGAAVRPQHHRRGAMSTRRRLARALAATTFGRRSWTPPPAVVLVLLVVLPCRWRARQLEWALEASQAAAAVVASRPAHRRCNAGVWAPRGLRRRPWRLRRHLSLGGRMIGALPLRVATVAWLLRAAATGVRRGDGAGTRPESWGGRIMAVDVVAARRRGT